MKVERGERFHVDTIDLYSSRSRAEFGRRAGKALELEADPSSRTCSRSWSKPRRQQRKAKRGETPKPPPMSDAERDEALAFLKRPDLLDQVAATSTPWATSARTNKRLLYLVAVSRKLQDPLSAVILSARAGRARAASPR